MITTSTAVFIGCLPLAIILFYFYNSKLPFARGISSCSMMISRNFGTVYAIFVLVMFRSYRKAVVGMVSSFCKGIRRVLVHPSTSLGMSTNYMFTHVNSVRY
uniref:G_PROTEIN_RECEP_F1_2 domain-containing protein n=1 Tax=Steinernema glaseri TaxID=37863 RepID=A0A1I7Z0Y0_9BILA